MEPYYWDIIQTLLLLLIGAVTYNVKADRKVLNDKFNDMLDDFDRLKDIIPTCHFPDMDMRVGKVEKKQGELSPILLDIRTRLVKVQTDIEWIKEVKNN